MILAYYSSASDGLVYKIQKNLLKQATQVQNEASLYIYISI